MERLVMRPRCYIASPLGFTEAGRYYYERVYLPALATIVDPIDPWSLTSDEEIALAHSAGRATEMSLEIGRRNIEAIRRSQLLVACLDGQEPDSGTVAEVGFAAGLGITCFGLRSDFRESGERGVVVNLQVAAFIHHSGGQILATLDELLLAVRRFTAIAHVAPVGC